MDGVAAASNRYKELGLDSSVMGIGLSPYDLELLKAIIAAHKKDSLALDRILQMLALAEPQNNIVSYEVGRVRGRPLLIMAMLQDDGTTKWKVDSLGCLDKTTMQIVYEPISSSRSDDFLARTRFSREEAFSLAKQYVEKIEREVCENCAKFYKRKLGTGKATAEMGFDPGDLVRCIRVTVDEDNVKKAKELPLFYDGYRVIVSGENNAKDPS